MKIRELLLLILVATMLPLTAMAYASPPDPSWPGGFFDDDDDDDVIALITSSSVAVDAFPLDAVSPVPRQVVAIVAAENAKAPTAALSHGNARAPPLA